MVEKTTGVVSQGITCKECFNFKTVTITTYNVKHFYFQFNKPLNKGIQNYGQVQVWFCKKQQLPRAVYLTKEYAYALTSMNCDCQEL